MGIDPNLFPRSGDGAMIRCERLVKNFGPVRALRGIDLDVPVGTYVGLFGANGAGKSTLLKILAGLVSPTSGSIWMDGSPLDRFDEGFRKAVGMISHQSFLYDHLTALENLQFFAELFHVEHFEERIGYWLHEVKLYSRKNDLVRTFSRGMVQRLTIARALLHDPKVLFLDEPFAGLDQDGSDYFKTLLGKIKGEGKTAVMAVHDVSLGFDLCDRLVVLENGRTCFSERVDAVSRDEFRTFYRGQQRGNSD